MRAEPVRYTEMSPNPSDREARLVEELDKIQRQIEALFAPRTEGPASGEAAPPTPLRNDERTRLHERRSEVRAELDELRAGQADAEGLREADR